MIKYATPIPDLWVIEPRVFTDNRGYFFESFNAMQFEKAMGFQLNFVQDNQSLSSRGVMRGLHYQLPPHDQSKLIRAIVGEILDVAVDIRKGSPTYGKHFSIILSAENKKQLFVPKGFAHGFVVLSEKAEICYRCDNFYAPQHEGGIHYSDPELNIDWKMPNDQLIVSEKDQELPFLHLAKNTFQYDK
jgi:dTDP-4-dehydrorhamnose 3,5-epimerase